MSNVLLLTADEQNAFDALGASLKEGWQTEEEKFTNLETPKQLQMRFHMSSLGKYPAMKALAQKVETGEKLEMETSLAGFTEDMIPEVFFLLGARGLSSLIHSVLAKAVSDDELKAVAAWSQVRHDLLQTNASIS